LVRLKAVPIEKGYSLYSDPKRVEEYVALFKI